MNIIPARVVRRIFYVAQCLAYGLPTLKILGPNSCLLHVGDLFFSHSGLFPLFKAGAEDLRGACVHVQIEATRPGGEASTHHAQQASEAEGGSSAEWSERRTRVPGISRSNPTKHEL